MTITMYDTIDVSQVPSNPQAVAGYVGGFWPDFSALVARFPNAHHLSIAVNAGENADCLDVENGDASPSQAPAWCVHQIARGVQRPCVYANASTMPAVIKALTDAGLKREQYRLWVAHYTFVAPNTPYELGADAVQYTDRGLNRNLDVSVCVNDFFSDPKPQPVVNSVHYDWFYAGPFSSPWGNIDEKTIVERYDGARKRPLLYKLYLKKLESQLKFLADRVAAEAIHHPIAGRPSWGEFRRGWRYQQLIHRAQGQKFV